MVSGPAPALRLTAGGVDSHDETHDICKRYLQLTPQEAFHRTRATSELRYGVGRVKRQGVTSSVVEREILEDLNIDLDEIIRRYCSAW